MKHAAIAALALTMLAGAAAAQTGAPIVSGEATAHVWVDVVANIAVGVVTPNVDIGQVASGQFPATVIFRIDANMESVLITVVATDLYKGDDPESEWIIPVVTGSGVGATVQPTNANPMQGHSNVLIWQGQAMINGMNARQSETWAFESSQAGHFSQDVAVTIPYNQADPELPKGEYSGFVRIIAELAVDERPF